MPDWPAFGEALWSVSDELGIRPEWQLPVLWLESKLDPSICNPGGCCGINQLCPGTYDRYVHVPVSEYRTWTASEQLSGPVRAYWRDALAFGPIRSAARLMLAQLGHKLLRSAPTLDSVVFKAPSREYEGNAKVFDPTRRGYFTVRDLADVLARQSRNLSFCERLSYAYSLRPGERPRDPIYGDDFPNRTWGFSCPDMRVEPPALARRSKAPVVAAVTIVVVTAYGLYKAFSHKPEPDRRIPPRPPPRRIPPPPPRPRPPPRYDWPPPDDWM
jgi:hypothetical protein